MYNNIPSNYCLVYALHIRHGYVVYTWRIQLLKILENPSTHNRFLFAVPIKNCPLFQQSSSSTSLNRRLPPHFSSLQFSAFLFSPTHLTPICHLLRECLAVLSHVQPPALLLSTLIHTPLQLQKRIQVTEEGHIDGS